MQTSIYCINVFNRELIMLTTAKPTIDINEPSIKIYKVIVVGDSNVGKTSLTYRFCEGQFLEAPEATIGVDFRERVLNIDGQEIKLQLWDTAGQERFRKSMVQHYYRNVHAVIFVYDVSNAASFDSLKQWIEEVDKHSFNDIPRILVGNKCDVKNAVNTNVAQKFADLHNMPLFETSARLDSHCDNVEAIFLTLAHKLKSRKPMIPSPIASISISSGDSRSTQSCC